MLFLSTVNKFVIFVNLFSTISCQQRTVLDDIFAAPFRILRDEIFKTETIRLNSTSIMKQLQEKNKWQEIIDESVPFPCSLKNARSKIRPESVNKLKPGDIDVIGAIGDSTTAGYGLRALTVSDTLYESRDLSFIGGGYKTWRECLTLPNILKVFNPNLIGYATGPSLIHHKDSQFNVAESGAVSKDIPYLTTNLIKRMINDPRIDINKDWKIISFMIGDNDFCSQMCYKENAESVLEEHRKDLIQALSIIRDNLPNTIVNLITPPTLELAYQIKDLPLICRVASGFFCPCIRGMAYQNHREQFIDIMKRWQQVDAETAFRDEFQTDNFAVVLQPFMINYRVPNATDARTIKNFSSEDCFHFSQKIHAKIANDLWNNMMEPVGNKMTGGNPFFSKFNCPTEENPFIFTKKNSK